jgi:chorismate mutase
MSDCTLAALRGEIDSIDDAILELIERRLRVSRSIAAAKAEQAGGRLTLRPRRQAAVVARLQRRAASVPPAAVAAVWRELMACGLQIQAPTELVLSGAAGRPLLEAQARAQFGCVAPVSWEADPAKALRRAMEEEAVAIIAGALPEVPEALAIFDMLRDAAGAPVAYVIGRVAAEDACLPPPGAGGAAEGTRWSPESWRRRTATQMPVWPDAASLAVVEESLAGEAPLVPLEEALALKARLAEVAAGRAFLVQGGDCAESFAEFSPEKVRRDERLLLGFGGLVGDAARCPIVLVARAAGQFAKPRSAAVECQSGVSLPAYRGDAVNGRGFSGPARAAEPARLLEVYRQSNATLALLAASRAAEPNRPAIYASHEALLLNYEQALTRRDSRRRHLVGRLGPHGVDWRKDARAGRRPCRICRRHRQSDRHQMRPDPFTRRAAAADRPARPEERAWPADPCRPLRRRPGRGRFAGADACRSAGGTMRDLGVRSDARQRSQRRRDQDTARERHRRGNARLLRRRRGGGRRMSAAFTWK